MERRWSEEDLAALRSSHSDRYLEQAWTQKHSMLYVVDTLMDHIYVIRKKIWDSRCTLIIHSG